MRKQLPPSYSVLVVRNGAVIAFEMNGKIEYLGTDGLWHRRKEHCDAFDNAATAEAKITTLEAL